MKKFVNLFLVVITMIMLGVVNVKAAGELDAMFQKIAPDDTFTINFRKPKQMEDAYDYSSAYISSKYRSYWGYLNGCDESYTNCTLYLTYYGSSEQVSDSKRVKVVWNEEYSQNFKKLLAADNVLRVNYRKPKDINDAQRFLNGYIQYHGDKNINLSVNKCNDDYSECIITLYNIDETGNQNSVGESNVVNMDWVEEYSEDFKKIAPNNVVTIKNMKPTNGDINGYTTSYFDKLYPNINGTLENCNSDLTICDLALYKDSSYRINEIHQVKVVWKEQLSELFNSIAPNGGFNIKSIKPQKEEDLEFYSVAAISQSFTNVLGYLLDCNKGYTECTLSISEVSNSEDGFFQAGEVHRVKVVWEKENPIARKLVDAAVTAVKLGKKDVHTYVDEVSKEKFETVEYYHVLEDLKLINFLQNQKNKNISHNISINFVSELKLLFENTNISYNLDTRLGDAYYFYEMGGGQLSLLYKGVVYALVNPNDKDSSYTSVYNNYVLYVPSDTANTKEAYLNAIKKRLDEYLNEDVKVEVGGLVKDYTNGEKLVIPHFSAKENQIGDYYYKITINNKTYDFLVVRDTSKMIVNNLVKSIDIDTKVKVETTATDIPIDAIISVNPITKDNTIYSQIVDSLKTDLFQAFDINLYSESLGTNITKTETGEFKITMPIMESLKDKDLIVYYIKDDGTLEEHPVTIDSEGNAVFTTNHFSTYILAEKISNEDASENPPTGDNIMINVLVSMISLGSLVTLLKVRKYVK